MFVSFSDAAGDTLGTTTITSSTDSQQKQNEGDIGGKKSILFTNTSCRRSWVLQLLSFPHFFDYFSGAAGDTLVSTTISSSTDGQQNETEIDIEGTK